MNNRIAVLAIYNTNGILRSHIVKLVDDLSESCDRLICVCESKINECQIRSIRKKIDKLIFVNTRKLGRGEAYWYGVKYLFEKKLITECQDIILCDINLYTYFSDLSVLIKNISSIDGEDVISLFSRPDREIIGSFLYIKSALINNGQFVDYWNDYRFPSLFRLGREFFDNDFLSYFRASNYSFGYCFRIELNDDGQVTYKAESGYSGVFISEDLVELPRLLYDTELIRKLLPSTEGKTEKLKEFFESKYVDHYPDNRWDGLLSWVNIHKGGKVYVFSNKEKNRAGIMDLFRLFGFINTISVDTEDELNHIVFRKEDGFIIDGETEENSKVLDIILRYIPYSILYYHNISGKALIKNKVYGLAVQRIIWNNISRIKRI